MRILVICSRNQWRSPTGEAVFRRIPGVEARSAGVSTQARRRVSESDLRWADRIYVMESEHARRLRRAFPDAAREVDIVVLDIPDDYRFMDPDLVSMFEAEAQRVMAEIR